MTNICYLLVWVIVADIVEHGWYIVDAHLIPTEGPVLILVMVWVIGGVVS